MNSNRRTHVSHKFSKQSTIAQNYRSLAQQNACNCIPEASTSFTKQKHPTAVEICCSHFTASMTGTRTYSSSFKVLTFEQFSKLDALMNSQIHIHGQGTFPDIKVCLKDFVILLKNKLQTENTPLDSIRLNGGAASHVVGTRQIIDDIGYNDLDLIFGLTSSEENVFEQVRKLLYVALRELLPQEPAFEYDSAIEDGYVQKMVKVSNGNDCWSLISLNNNDGENIEVKFVHKMKRQYEFSVDSFQIEMDSLLNCYEYKNNSVKFSKEFYPTVMAESKFGKFDEALFHLNNKLVATLRPEEIRGGGLLKYCNLLLNGYNIADSDIKNLERYMCSRFFIDFPDANSQQNKLQSYMRTHLRKAPKSKFNSGGNVTPCNGQSTDESNATSDQKFDDGSVEQHRMNFIVIVRRVIDESTVCLMNIERACTLSLLENIIADLIRSYMAKNEGKIPPESAESGYFSENSSMNSLSSSSHFSRSSSPSYSTNGTAHGSRSPSPATFNGRLTPYNLSSAATFQHFSQFHPMVHNQHFQNPHNYRNNGYQHHGGRYNNAHKQHGHNYYRGHNNYYCQNYNTRFHGNQNYQQTINYGQNNPRFDSAASNQASTFTPANQGSIYTQNGTAVLAAY